MASPLSASIPAFSSSHPGSPTTSPSSPERQVRQMTSSTVLSPSQRNSQLLQINPGRAGTRSPSSIPSSPTSVHSSSSAIFERDIEPVASSSPPHSALHPANPHRVSRAKGTEQLEQSVPSVLDSAAEVLATSFGTEDYIDVVAPSVDSGRRSGFASPVGSFRSRSPSPRGSRLVSPVQQKSLLLSIPSPVGSSYTHVTTPMPGFSPGLSPPGTTSPLAIRPTIQTNPSPTASGVHTPTSTLYASATSSIHSSPTTTTAEHPLTELPIPLSESPPHTLAPLTYGSPSSPAGLHVPTSRQASLSLPPSPKATVSKRLSFMSYSDLLTSTPASVVPLSSLTASATTSDPPPHIPSVSGLTQAQAHAQSLSNSFHGGIPGNQRDSVLFEEMGGEWEREGLGSGLEERLEALMRLEALEKAPVAVV